MFTLADVRRHSWLHPADEQDCLFLWRITNYYAGFGLTRIWQTLVWYVEVLHTWYNPYKAKKAVFYAILFWIVGFVWGSAVFIVSSLKNLPSIPYLSKYPAISFPLLIAYIILLFLLVPRYLNTTERKKVEGLKFGATIFLINFVLDFFLSITRC
jgi:hypothetical protein